MDKNLKKLVNKLSTYIGAQVQTVVEKTNYVYSPLIEEIPPDVRALYDFFGTFRINENARYGDFMVLDIISPCLWIDHEDYNDPIDIPYSKNNIPDDRLIICGTEYVSNNMYNYLSYEMGSETLNHIDMDDPTYISGLKNREDNFVNYIDEVLSSQLAFNPGIDYWEETLIEAIEDERESRYEAYREFLNKKFGYIYNKYDKAKVCNEIK